MLPTTTHNMGMDFFPQSGMTSFVRPMSAEQTVCVGLCGSVANKKLANYKQYHLNSQVKKCCRIQPADSLHLVL